jgi:hypothetical protein
LQDQKSGKRNVGKCSASATPGQDPSDAAARSAADREATARDARAYAAHVRRKRQADATAREAQSVADDAEAKRRERLCAAVDRELEADRIFFRLNPAVEYRLRTPGPAETAELELVLSKPLEVPAGFRLYSLIRCFHPKIRLRTWVAGPVDGEDASQEELAWLWEFAGGGGPADDACSATAARLRAEGDA